ncbi:MAG: DUF2569 domain-containing protein [Rhodocyclaceae bacterium]|jgi:hypothetical protein|nr:DUF2569 domain-containing protein [Rhodocyclaceae bacterium]
MDMLIALLVIVVVIALVIAHRIQIYANKYPPASPEQSAISGIGGWLLLLVTGFVFLGPAAGGVHIFIFFMSNEYRYPILTSVTEWGTYKFATWGIFLLACCLSFYAGLGLIIECSKAAIKRAKIIIWVNGPLANIILGALLPVLIFGRPELDPQFVGSMIASIIGAAIWTAYLSKSKRVKATYGITTPST